MRTDEIKNLIAKGKLKEAIAALPDCNEKIMLMGSYNDNIQNELLRDAQTNQINNNKLRHSLMSTIDHLEDKINSMGSVSGSENKLSKSGSSHEEKLTLVISENQRRNQEVVTRAISLRRQLREYDDQKAIDKTYDISGRRKKAIVENIERFFIELNDEQLDNVEDFIERINEILGKNTIPFYPDLREAYILCSGKGFSDSWIETQLKNQPDLDDTKITIAERLESFLTTLV